MSNFSIRSFQCAAKSIAAFCHLRKPPRVLVEKPLEEILHNIGKSLPNIPNNECYPGDRDDNLWITIDDYKSPKTQIEWEETCFLDKSFYGYYTWPKTIKYSINKRERYTLNNMTEKAAILYNRFIDKNFVGRVTQLMVFDDDKDKDGRTFDKIQFSMFKVDRRKDYKTIIEISLVI